MLKRLELVGFKSFADKTVFEFGDGITAIVGPNGSGKSNIVDAVRWIMGEQSAKSLRGGEMADVIFNGSPSRRSLGLAEVTMTFDNRRKQLASDNEEVQITRRVYRDSQGEYLINSQVCRLKDIKDLFLGSGAGNDAYAIIEQGRVDGLLQASTKERRSIFEEAAGISRFKAKKIETQRKLERVDQNLSRVKDIIDEVDKQLRGVKLQAGKAQRYQEYATRLKELRLGMGLEEYRQFSARLETETTELEKLRLDLDHRAARAGACEAEAERLEITLADLDDDLRNEESVLARVMQRIQTASSTLTHEGALSTDLEAELTSTRRRLMELSGRVRSLAEALEAAEGERAQADAVTNEKRSQSAQQEKALANVSIRLSEINQQIAADKNLHLEHMRRAAHLQNEVVSCKAQVDNLRRERERLRLRSDHTVEILTSIDLELHELTIADETLHGQVNAARQSHAEQRHLQEQLRRRRDELADTLSHMRQERSGLESRIDVLDGLIRSHEGVGTGVREVFALIEEGAPGPWQNIVGMIADFLTVKREFAPLIDLALGDWAQRFVVHDIDPLLEAIAQKTVPFTGRVSFLPIGQKHEPRGKDGSALADLRQRQLIEIVPLSRIRQLDAEHATNQAILVAPAEQLVSCDHPELGDLPSQLLGSTLIVRDLSAARALARSVTGLRFITLAGELLESDGTLTVGAHHAGTSILSRKSELLELREHVATINDRLAEAEQNQQRLREESETLERMLRERAQELDVLGEQASDLRGRVDRHRERRQGLFDEVAVHHGEMKRIEEEIDDLERSWQEAQEQAAAAESEVESLHQRLRDSDREIQTLEQLRQQQQESCTEARVALAQVQEQLAALSGKHQQLSRDYRQRQSEAEQSERILQACRARLSESQGALLAASATTAQAYLDKEVAQTRVQELMTQRDLKRIERARLAQQGQAARIEWRTQQEQFHVRELEAANLRHQRDSLAERLREDYQVELAELHQQRSTISSNINIADADNAESAPLDASAANEEIAELRRKLSRLGSVNLDSLAELNELEVRASGLTDQFDDLNNAKKSLEEIIAKINQDSRRLFEETFNTIKGHFQELFRKLFGGGMADVILEDETDILESGLEIVARPPGKELRNLSLLSGGEKTMTAVALLLAIFRSKPSPFCLLDEVDAALDEANIGRFTSVLRDFTESSQFIIVTHSKKTMAVADVIYGITMQESGISKQVAVRFDDWVEEEGAPALQEVKAG